MPQIEYRIFTPQGVPTVNHANHYAEQVAAYREEREAAEEAAWYAGLIWGLLIGFAVASLAAAFVVH